MFSTKSICHFKLLVHERNSYEFVCLIGVLKPYNCAGVFLVHMFSMKCWCCSAGFQLNQELLKDLNSLKTVFATGPMATCHRDLN